jgi:hypothetical protein
MGPLENETQGLREEVATLQEGMEKLTTMMTTLLAAQNQASVRQLASISLTQPNTYALPISTVFASSPQLAMLEGYLW